MDQDSPSRLLTLDEAGRALGLSAATVGRYTREGTLPAVRIGGRPKVTQAALAAFCEARRVPLPKVPA